jgi:glycine cleavage system H protein
MSDLRYTNDHEWVRLDGEVVTVGITTYAQEQLGDIVFVELPEVGRKVAKGDAMAVVESVKAASDIFAPLDGEVVEVNEALPDDPAKINADAEGEGWFCKLKVADRGELDGLMDAGAYKAFLDTL